MRILQHLHFTGKNQAHCPVRSGRRILIGMLATIFILSSCRRQALPHITLEDDFRLPVTSVRNQQQWPTGWIYATLALVETERILVGDSLDLSPDYLVRQLAGQLGNGRLGNPGRALTATDFQGSPARCIQLMERYGVILNGIYRDSLSTSCHQFCNIVNHLPAGNAGRQALQVVLDTTFDYLPSYVSLYGVVYTPHELLRSVVEEGSYQQLSIAEIHRNFGTPSHLIDRTLRHGHAIAWEGDTLQSGYSSRAGLAVCSSSDEATTTSRSALSTSSSRHRHCLIIIGIAHPRRLPLGCRDTSRTYYIAKDSHGAYGTHHGYIYLSAAYVEAHTLSLTRLRSAG
jgi:bleomycin hydrolase